MKRKTDRNIFYLVICMVTSEVVLASVTLFREKAEHAHNGSASADRASKFKQAPITSFFPSVITMLNPAFSNESHNNST